MAVLYEDQHVVCDNDALTIKNYHFPAGSKRIPYADVKKLELVEIGWLTGKLRMWGMGLAPYWFHLDWERPTKDKAIVVDTGEWLKSVVTPKATQQVYDILFAKVDPSAQTEAHAKGQG